MASNGWISLHRSLLKHWLFSFDEPDKALAWIDLLLSARHEPGTMMIKGRTVKLLSGQIAMSQVTLQKRWKMSQNKVKRFLKLLENEGMIELSTNELTTVITLCNYKDYQTTGRPDERANEQPDERGTNEPRTSRRTTNNNDNKGNNVNKDNNTSGSSDEEPKSTRLDLKPIFSMCSDEQISEIRAIRRQNKAPALTERSAKGIAKEISILTNLGFDIDQILSEWSMRGWKSLKADWIKTEPKQQQFHDLSGMNYGESRSL
jgi:DNA replication protein DnaD